MPLQTVKANSSPEMTIQARIQSSVGIRLLRSKIVFDPWPGKNWLKIGTSRAPVAVSNTATRTIATRAITKMNQCGRTYLSSRLRSSIANRKYLNIL